MKALYYGDNLQVLRDSIATESVDLIYLDPPFNSNTTYNVRCWRVSRPQFRAAACPFIAKSGLKQLLTGARDEFLLTATVQNLKRLANHTARPPPRPMMA